MRPAWTLAAIGACLLLLMPLGLRAQELLPPVTEDDGAGGAAASTESLTLILRRLPPVCDDLPAREGIQRLPDINLSGRYGLERLPGVSDEPAWSEADWQMSEYPRTVDFRLELSFHDEEGFERLPAIDE